MISHCETTFISTYILKDISIWYIAFKYHSNTSTSYQNNYYFMDCRKVIVLELGIMMKTIKEENVIIWNIIWNMLTQQVSYLLSDLRLDY